jgi:hypothetical protein
MGSLALGSTVIQIPDDLAWPDEWSWAEVAQKKTYSITGALLVESAQKKAGRPITLQSDDTSAWVSRSDVANIRSFIANVGDNMTLFIRGQFFTVVFDHDAGAMSASPVVDYADPDIEDWYLITLRFIEVGT